MRPERGGHSIEKVLLFNWEGHSRPQRPRRYNLPASLLQLAQRNESAFRHKPCLFLKLTLRSQSGDLRQNPIHP